MKTGLSVLKLTVAVAVVASVSAAMAQPQGGGQGRGRGRGGFGGFGVQPTAIILNETVQKDLEVTEDQKTKLTSLVDDLRQSMRGNRGAGGAGAGGGGGAPDFAAIAQRAREQRDEQVKKIDEVLIPSQQERFAQILLQAQGPAQALADPKVADKLGLTADQKQKLTALTDEYRQKRMDLGFQAPPEDRQKLTTEENDKAKDLLTGDQKTQLDKMLGKKIDVDFAALGRGGRGGAGGRRGGGGGAGGAGGAGPGA